MSKFLNAAGKTVEGIALIGCMPSFVILIGIIALFRSCMGYDEIGIDSSHMVRRYLYDREYITDSTGNGYECLWYTTKAVTSLRFDEIYSRQHLRDSYKDIERKAADHFNHNLINTNIYDFVEYIKQFDIDSADVRLVNIWAYGTQYKKLYQQPHPDYPDGWRFGDDRELGVLFLKELEIYPYNFDAPQMYRYWKCDATSLTDERHTHVTTVERKNGER